MEFQSNGKAIYLQIVDYICEKILMKDWKAEDKIPSVRELAVSLAVNPNTVARSYDFLKQQEIIFDKRGIGYFVSKDSFKNAKTYRIQQFQQNELPPILRIMSILGIELESLQSTFENFKKNNNENK